MILLLPTQIKSQNQKRLTSQVKAPQAWQRLATNIFLPSVLPSLLPSCPAPSQTGWQLALARRKESTEASAPPPLRTGRSAQAQQGQSSPNFWRLTESERTFDHAAMSAPGLLTRPVHEFLEAALLRPLSTSCHTMPHMWAEISR